MQRADEILRQNGLNRTDTPRKTSTASSPREERRADQAECARCLGAQFIIRPAQRGESGNICFTQHGPGKLVPCPSCNGVDRRQEYLRGMCRLRGDELRFDFDNYWTRQHGREPLVAAQYVLEHNGFLTLAGTKGLGKSYLLAAIVNEAVKRNRLAVYITMSELLEHLRRAYKPGVEVDFDGLWQTIGRCEVLCIDESDKYNPTPWAEERVQMLIDDRYRDWRSLATCFATNDVADCPGYLKSRMLDGRFMFVQMQGADVRPELERE